MEHRWNARSPISARVELRTPGGRCLSGRTRNVSPYGMYVETEAASLQPQAFVTVTLRGAQLPPATLPALVVHRDRGGLGLMFADYDRDVMESLETVCACATG